MITFFDVAFARDQTEFDTLAHTSLNCIGYYRKMARGIRLYNAEQMLFAFIVHNAYPNTGFIVSAIQEQKQINYMYCTTTRTDAILGIDQHSFADCHNECARIIKQLYPETQQPIHKHDHEDTANKQDNS